MTSINGRTRPPQDAGNSRGICRTSESHVDQRHASNERENAKDDDNDNDNDNDNDDKLELTRNVTGSSGSATRSRFLMLATYER